MRIGDIIVQRAVMPPIGFGICAEFAVRIWALIGEPSKLGFAYETLAGHLERGVSEFYLRSVLEKSCLSSTRTRSPHIGFHG